MDKFLSTPFPIAAEYIDPLESVQLLQVYASLGSLVSLYGFITTYKGGLRMLMQVYRWGQSGPWPASEPLVTRTEVQQRTDPMSTWKRS